MTLLRTKVPVFIVVVPVYVLAPDKVSVPVPLLVTPPVPLITPLMVIGPLPLTVIKFPLLFIVPDIVSAVAELFVIVIGSFRMMGIEII